MSTSSSAPASWTTWLIGSIGWAAPVLVSAWTMPTTLKGPCCGDGVLHLLGREDLAPGDLDGGDLRAGPLGDILHPLAEDAGDADEHLVAGLDQVDHAGLHAGRAGAADGEGQRFWRLEDGLEHLADVVEDLQELRVEVAEGRGGHGLQHARVDVGRARAHEQARFDLCQVQHSL